MRGVALDFATLAATDLELRDLESALPEWAWYPSTRDDQLLDRLQGCDVALINKIVLSEAHFSRLPQLKLVVIMATGTDNVDLQAAARHGIAVCNVTAYSTPSVVQHTFAMMLSLRMHLRQYDEAVRAGRWQQSPHFSLLAYPADELAGSVLGIVGYGAIGRGVESVARAFGMEVCVARGVTNAGSVQRMPLQDMLPRVDVLSLHCPLTEATRNLIDAQALSRMKPGAILVNVARGGVVDEAALAAALRGGMLAGAAVDVLAQEPPRAGSPLLEQGIPNLIVTPHIAWGSRQARQRLVGRVAAIIAAFCRGSLDGCVNGVCVPRR